jgi:hypothetical protein
MLNYIKSKRISIVTLTIAVICIAFLGVISWRNSASASSSQALFDTHTINAKDVALKFVSATRDGGFITAVFCYNLPSSDDWQLAQGYKDASLTINNQVYYLYGGGLQDSENASNQSGKQRCSYLLFEVPEEISGEATITINRLITSLSDVYDCGAAQAKLNQSNKGKGIVISCENKDHSSGFSIQAKPDSLSIDDARKIVQDDGFSSIIDGPWAFSTTIK